MPYCPDCGTEYRPGFDTCADCGCLLVEHKPEVVQYLPQTNLKLKALSIFGQACAFATFSIFVFFIMMVAAEALPPQWERGLLLTLPCAMLFTFGWFLHDWLSPNLVWIFWATVGITVVVANANTINAVDTLTALIALPIAGALPITCGIYFGKMKRLYMFFIPFLAYAVIFRILFEASN